VLGRERQWRALMNADRCRRRRAQQNVGSKRTLGVCGDLSGVLLPASPGHRQHVDLSLHLAGPQGALAFARATVGLSKLQSHLPRNAHTHTGDQDILRGLRRKTNYHVDYSLSPATTESTITDTRVRARALSLSLSTMLISAPFLPCVCERERETLNVYSIRVLRLARARSPARIALHQQPTNSPQLDTELK
jgi:hypothetical protein